MLSRSSSVLTFFVSPPSGNPVKVVKNQFFVYLKSCMGSSSTKIVNMNGPKAEMVRQTLGAHKVVIFSKTYCPYCTMAKEQFRKLSVPVHVVELDGRDDGDEIQNILAEITGNRTVPRCFIDGQFIGGGTDVKKMYEQGTLQKYFV